MNLIFDTQNDDFYISIIDKISHLFDHIVILNLEEKKYNELCFSNPDKFHLINEYLDPENLSYDLDYYNGLEDYDEFLNLAKITEDAYIRDGLKYSDQTIIKDNIFRYYLFWNRILIQHKIDCVIRLSGVPHFSYDLSLFYLAELRKKKIIFSWHSGVNSIIYLGNTLLHNDKFNYYKLGYNSSVKKFVNDFLIEKLSVSSAQKYQELTPYYMKLNLRQYFVRIKLMKFFAVFKRLIIDEQRFMLVINQFSRMINQKGALYIRELKRKASIDLPTNFVYLPLHLQPEASTIPLGYLYSRLPILIAEAINLIPYEYKIVIKENPKQTSHSRLKRYVDLYDHNRVHLVPSNYDTYELIRKSSLVISITGTAILEASLMGKNSILLGNNIYHLLPNVYKLDNKLKEKILSLLSKELNETKIEDFDYYVSELSESGIISPRLSKMTKNFTLEEIDNISNSLLNLIKF